MVRETQIDVAVSLEFRQEVSLTKSFIKIKVCDMNGPYFTLHQSNQFGLCVPYVAGTQMELSLLDYNVRPNFSRNFPRMLPFQDNSNGSVFKNT